MTPDELLNLRTATGLTQSAFAELLGYTGQHRRTIISDMESGRHGIGRWKAEGIRKVVADYLKQNKKK